MQASQIPRAVAAARSIASSRGLTADDAVVLHDSNKLTLRLLPAVAGRHPDHAHPIGLAAATIATIPAAIWWARRGRRRRPAVIGGAVAAVCIAALLALPSLGREASGGRDITLYQLSYVTPATLTLLGAAAFAGLAAAMSGIVRGTRGDSSRTSSGTAG